MGFKVLILGGTTEARVLAELLTQDARYLPLLSFAGRTHSLQRPDVPHRVGGFGGAVGLGAFLRAGRFGALIDATHAFAAQISQNALRAAEATDTPLLRLVPSAWQRAEHDLWHEVSDMQAAAQALGAQPRRVFLSVGRLELEAFCAAPQHAYLIRAVDTFTLPEPLRRAHLISARGPFSLADEAELLRSQAIELVVSKNAGTSSTYAKIEAARALRIPVIMVQRPVLPPAPEAVSRDAALHWLAALHGASERGV